MDDLQSAYEDHFSTKTAADFMQLEWTDLNARQKVNNILTVLRAALGPVIYSDHLSVLECGSGEGSNLKALSDRLPASLYGLDISPSVVQFVKDRSIPRLVDVRAYDGNLIPYPDKRFDVAVCLHVLEHVENPRALLRELRRVSRLQVLEVPLDYAIAVDQRVDYFMGHGHINVFTPSTFKFLLRSEGFEIVSEHRSRATKEILAYDWFMIQKYPKTMTRRLKVALRDQIFQVKRLVMGKQRFEETTFTAFTCCVKPVSTLKAKLFQNSR